MVLECLPIGLFGSNCYIVGDNGEGVFIDAGVDADEACKAAEKKGLKIKYIILTHGHIDHICYVDFLRERTGAKVVIHEADAPAMADSLINGAAMVGKNYQFKKPDIFVKDGDIIEVGGLKLEIIHTPGHTLGGICIKVGTCVFTGDTLFRMSIGRTDFAGGDYDEIIRSIKNKLLNLSDDIVVYPGHMEPSTIGLERKKNPFLR